MAARMGTAHCLDLREQAFAVRITLPLPNGETEQVPDLLVPLDTDQMKSFLSGVGGPLFAELKIHTDSAKKTLQAPTPPKKKQTLLASLNIGREAQMEFQGWSSGSYKSCVVCSSSQKFPCYPRSRLRSRLGKGTIVAPHGPSGLTPGHSEFMTLGAMATPAPMGCARGLTPRMRFSGADTDPDLLWPLTFASAWDTDGYPTATFPRTPCQPPLTPAKHAGESGEAPPSPPSQGTEKT